MVSFSLLTSRERTRAAGLPDPDAWDWTLAFALDLLTVAWVGLLVAWWL